MSTKKPRLRKRLGFSIRSLARRAAIIEISESAVLAPDTILLRAFPFLVLGYYTSHYVMLVVGLSVIHRRRFSILFALAVLGPIALWGGLATVGWIISLSI
jgi:hypothetical protein